MSWHLKVSSVRVDSEISLATTLQAWPKNTVSQKSLYIHLWWIWFKWLTYIWWVLLTDMNCTTRWLLLGRYTRCTWVKRWIPKRVMRKLTKSCDYCRFSVQKANQIAMRAQWEGSADTSQVHLQGLHKVFFPIKFWN